MKFGRSATLLEVQSGEGERFGARQKKVDRPDLDARETPAFASFGNSVCTDRRALRALAELTDETPCQGAVMSYEKTGVGKVETQPVIGSTRTTFGGGSSSTWPGAIAQTMGSEV